jgi:hypothetical protein
MNMQRYIKILLPALVIISCEEPAELDLRQTPPKVVIEAQVTNKPNYQVVKISRSTDFYGSGQTPRITDAIVSVTDDAGNEYTFIHNPRNHADSMGIYLPQVNFSGEIGRTYTLHVNADGKLFEASDKMFSVTPIDSMQFRINEDQQEEAEEPGKIYELLVYAKEPQDEDNYYLFKYYRNDSLTVFNPTDIYYSDDELLGENINGIPSPVYYGSNDIARLEVYSLTRQGYVFYNDLAGSLNNDGGGMFGPIPAPPRSNLTNDALGFFQVSAVHEKEVRIQ